MTDTNQQNQQSEVRLPAPCDAFVNPLSATEALGDGRYCRHHDDDPAHGAICYVKTLYEVPK